MHKQYRKIGRIGRVFQIAGASAFLSAFCLISFMSFRQFSVALLLSAFIVLCGLFMSGLSENYFFGLCRLNRTSLAFDIFCTGCLCTNCNLSLMETTLKKISDGTDRRLTAKLGYELGLINEKEVKPFFRIF